MNNQLNPPPAQPNAPVQADNRERRRKYQGKYFVMIIVFAIVSEYYCYVFQIMMPQLPHSNFWLILFLVIIFNLLMIMMIWSFFITMNTHPGEIPLYWGFYIGDDDYKRKRYCLICNAFKPERSHHCSVCNVCILNMDHHCPWVDNCVGFYNRKYFMQLLFYLTLLLLHYDTSALYFAYATIRDVIVMKMLYPHKIRAALMLIGYMFVLVFSGFIFVFIKIHIKLVLTNSTTIESLDKEHENENLKYRLSMKENFYQVFGLNKLLWFFPLIVESGRPDGDGLSWKVNPLRENIEMNNRNNQNNNNDNNENDNNNNNDNYNSDNSLRG